ncbi:MAG: hypothetical protein HYZ27_03625 [Deltaproteobacteria bacterium]|nr:hypothetical protein [Deltaproteobacteria bacterium]
MFEATSGGSAPGLVQAAYPPGGIGQGNYVELDRTTWSGATATPFGNSLAVIGHLDGHDGVDIMAGPGHVTTAGRYATFMYSFDASTLRFEKRAVLFGSASFGTTIIGLGGFVTGADAELVISSRSAASLFHFR